MSDVTFYVLQLIVCVSIVIIMRYVIPYLRIKLLKVTDDSIFSEVIKAVKSVQQDPIFKESLGSVKKEEVIIRITAWANSCGIKISQKQLSQLIETAVYMMKNEDK